MSRRLVLGSGSPRRKELLSMLGLRFDVAVSNVEELAEEDESPEEFVSRVALEKGREVARRYDDAVVLAADTIVVLAGEILGKPADNQGAIAMLRNLSGKEHAVLTAVAVVDSASGRVDTGLERTRVWFRDLYDREIAEYVRREHVFDKAGGYAIQGLAAAFIPRIEGNYANVVGLPVPLVVELLKRQGVDWVTAS